METILGMPIPPVARAMLTDVGTATKNFVDRAVSSDFAREVTTRATQISATVQQHGALVQKHLEKTFAERLETARTGVRDANGLSADAEHAIAVAIILVSVLLFLKTKGTVERVILGAVVVGVCVWVAMPHTTEVKSALAKLVEQEQLRRMNHKQA